MTGERRTLSENMLIEQGTNAGRSSQPSYFEPTLEDLAASKTIINFLKQNDYKVDIV